MKSLSQLKEVIKDEAGIIAVADRLGLKLKQYGTAHKCCCPIHNEKTASFNASPKFDTYHCFGCGTSGDQISLVMAMKRFDFIDALKWLAKEFSIVWEFEKETPEQKKKRATRKAKIEPNRLVAREWFTNLKKNHTYLDEMGWSATTRTKFGIGITGESLAGRFVNSEHFELAVELGLIGSNSTRQWEVYEDRIMFPIVDYKQNLVGFTGRTLLEKKKNNPKWKNSKASDLYKKDEVLYGLVQANQDPANRREAKIHIVEGCTDVVSMHDVGFTNTVAALGTALSEKHLKRLWKCGYRSICFMYDGDKAGRAAFDKSLKLALELGFTCTVSVLPEGEDPHSIIRSSKVYPMRSTFNWCPIELQEEEPVTRHLSAFFEITELDALDYLFRSFNIKSPGQRIAARNSCVEYLAAIKSDTSRHIYIDEVVKLIKVNKKDLKDDIQKLIDDSVDEEDVVATNFRMAITEEQAEEVDKFGFFENKDQAEIGYYFQHGLGFYNRESNFLIEPLFHIYSKSDNKRLVKIKNNRKESIVEVPSKALVSHQLLREIFAGEGNFFFQTAKNEVLMKIILRLGENFPLCHEVRYLGWQRKGFYAFSNGILNGKFTPVDGYGIVQHKDENYFLPAFSKIYENSDEDDDYSNDRYYKYHDTPYTFMEVAKLMDEVYSYNRNGKVAVAFLVASCFRDFIYEQHRFFPHLFLFGQSQAGKSQLGWTLDNWF